MNTQLMKRYEDIIHLPHYYPPERKRMPRLNRAAQFAAFAALKGYSEEVKLTGERHRGEAI